jgi:hypothetical protein
LGAGYVSVMESPSPEGSRDTINLEELQSKVIVQVSRACRSGPRAISAAQRI